MKTLWNYLVLPFQVIKFYRQYYKKIQSLKSFMEKYQPVGMPGKIQNIMNWNYNP